MLRVLLFLSFFTPLAYAESVRIQILDLGQADGFVIRSPNHEHWIVIDAGRGGKLSTYIQEMGIDEIDLAVVTHRHADHQGGMDEILSTTSTKAFIGVTADCPNRVGDDKVREAVDDHSVTITPLSSTPQTLTYGDITLTVLPLPPLSACPNHDNSNSIVVRLDYDDFSMLFTGDADEDELDWLVENHRDLLDVYILKASHHGSDNGYTDAFLVAVSPERVVISAGVHGTYKHPMPGAVEAYRAAANNRVYCTNRHGTIRIYGYKNGDSRFFTQRKTDKSCVYDGTRY